jgi:hypothetical protein
VLRSHLETAGIGVRDTKRLSVERSGEIHYLRIFPDPIKEREQHGVRPVRFRDLFSDITSMLRLATSVYPTLADYHDALFLGVAGENIYDRPFEWPTSPQTVAPVRRVSPDSLDVPWQDETLYRIGEDPIAVTRQVLASLCWRAGYGGYESYLDAWGTG